MEEKLIHCTNCYYGNKVGEDVCEVCGSPLGIIEPPKMEKFFTGDLDYNVSDRPKIVIALGVWIMFFPSAVVFSYLAMQLIFDKSLIPAIFVVLFSLLLTSVVIKTTINYRKAREIDQKKSLVSAVYILIILSLSFGIFFYQEVGKYPLFQEYSDALEVTLITTNDQIERSDTLTFCPPNEEELEFNLPNNIEDGSHLRIPLAYNNGSKDIYIKIKIIPKWLNVLNVF